MQYRFTQTILHSQSKCQCIFQIAQEDKSADSPNPDSKLFALEDWKSKWVNVSNNLMLEITQ